MGRRDSVWLDLISHLPLIKFDQIYLLVLKLESAHVTALHWFIAPLHNIQLILSQFKLNSDFRTECISEMIWVLDLLDDTSELWTVWVLDTLHPHLKLGRTISIISGAGTLVFITKVRYCHHRCHHYGGQALPLSENWSICWTQWDTFSLPHLIQLDVSLRFMKWTN